MYLSVVGWGEVGVVVECLGEDLWYKKGKRGDETCVSEGYGNCKQPIAVKN